MRPTSIRTVIFGSLLFAAACSPPKAVEEKPKELESKSQNVTAAQGGTITTESGLRISIPAGALDGDTEVTVKVSEQKLDGFEVSGYVYTFGPAGLKFSAPVSITFPDDGNADTVVFWTTESDPNEFEPVTTVNGTGVKIGLVTHFSRGFIGKGTCGTASCEAGSATCSDATHLTVVSSATSCSKGAAACINNSVTIDCGAGGCADGKCIVTCGQGALDCDGTTVNGCESNVVYDAKNCGACGNACAAGEVCGGRCVAANTCTGAFYALGGCVATGGNALSCLGKVSAGLEGADRDNFNALQSCIIQQCAASSTPDVCGQQALASACAAQAVACFGVPPPPGPTGETGPTGQTGPTGETGPTGMVGCETTGCPEGFSCNDVTHQCQPIPCEVSMCPDGFSCNMQTHACDFVPPEMCSVTTCTDDEGCGEGGHCRDGQCVTCANGGTCVGTCRSANECLSADGMTPPTCDYVEGQGVCSQGSGNAGAACSVIGQNTCIEGDCIETMGHCGQAFCGPPPSCDDGITALRCAEGSTCVGFQQCVPLCDPANVQVCGSETFPFSAWSCDAPALSEGCTEGGTCSNGSSCVRDGNQCSTTGAPCEGEGQGDCEPTADTCEGRTCIGGENDGDPCASEGACPNGICGSGSCTTTSLDCSDDSECQMQTCDLSESFSCAMNTCSPSGEETCAASTTSDTVFSCVSENLARPAEEILAGCGGKLFEPHAGAFVALVACVKTQTAAQSCDATCVSQTMNDPACEAELTACAPPK